MTLVTTARPIGLSVSRSIRRSVCRCVGLTLIVILAGSSLLAQTTLTVAAAADLGPALPEIAANFEKSSGTHIAAVYGSSGNLATQIENGAPYDVFLSADLGYPHRLESQGLVVLGSLTKYASGKLVLWAPKTLGVDVRVLGMKALTAPEVRTIAIANPEHAPYGKAAVAALRWANLYDALKSKLVLGENVAQAAQFVTSGNAQIGIIPLSLAMAPELARSGQRWELPPESYPPITQGAVVLRKSKNEKVAQDFVNYLKTKEAAAILRRYGFEVPEPQP
ncbi:MAG: molybdate ABC transporter substrate-binding protein [Terriglobales bacterium]|jgi:molybdate transport system substrate-binding protein